MSYVVAERRFSYCYVMVFIGMYLSVNCFYGADQLTHHVTLHVISRVTTLTRKPFSMKCTPPSGRNLCDTARENTNIYETYHFPPRKSVKH